MVGIVVSGSRPRYGHPPEVGLGVADCQGIAVHFTRPKLRGSHM
jgi:hypothetical protein